MIAELCRIDPLVNAEYIINGRGPVFFKDFRIEHTDSHDTHRERKTAPQATLQEIEMKLELLNRSIDRCLRDIWSLTQ